MARAASSAFEVGVTFPSVRGEADGLTTPEELLAASHAVCFGIGVRSVLARHGGRAARINLTATVTAEKGPGGIRVVSAALRGVVHGLEGVQPAQLPSIASEAEQGCTISNAIRGAVAISAELCPA